MNTFATWLSACAKTQSHFSALYEATACFSESGFGLLDDEEGEAVGDQDGDCEDTQAAPAADEDGTYVPRRLAYRCRLRLSLLLLLRMAFRNLLLIFLHRLYRTDADARHLHHQDRDEDCEATE